MQGMKYYVILYTCDIICYPTANIRYIAHVLFNDAFHDHNNKIGLCFYVNDNQCQSVIFHSRVTLVMVNKQTFNLDKYISSHEHCIVRFIST